jgi:hypothetical protein
MPQIVNADIRQGAAPPEWQPPVVENDRLRAGPVGKNKFDAVSSVDAFQYISSAWLLSQIVLAPVLLSGSNRRGGFTHPTADSKSRPRARPVNSSSRMIATCAG